MFEFCGVVICIFGFLWNYMIWVDLGFVYFCWCRLNMVLKQLLNNFVYKFLGGFKNFVEFYGGRLWNDVDVQEVKVVGVVMKQYDVQ